MCTHYSYVLLNLELVIHSSLTFMLLVFSLCVAFFLLSHLLSSFVAFLPASILSCFISCLLACLISCLLACLVQTTFT